MLNRFRKRLAAWVAVSTVLGTVLTAAATQAATPRAPITTATPLPSSNDLLRLAAGSPAAVPLTLITGDKVHIGLSAAGRPVVREIQAAPRPHGAPVAFHTFTKNTNVYVVPNDALAQLGSGLLDWGLFDVAKLAALAVAGKAGQVPVIVSYTDKAAAQRSAGTYLASINGRSMTIDGGGQWWGQARALSSVRKIWLNELVPISLDQSVPQIGAPIAWARGFDGTGVTVAVLDTGIDANHPDVAGKVVGRADFTGTAADAKDGHGHGTHVAATIAGTGAASNGQRKGVAPGAKLLAGKVCDNGGSCPFDAIIAGMEWAAHSEAKVINMSLGGQATDGTDPLSVSLNNLSRSTGRLFVVAAGNSGPTSGTVGAPGAADEALTVAAVDKDDRMADFSSRGPRVGDGAAKPDIAGPGVSIVAARAAGTSMGTVVDQYYTSASGTSMATPHVAGAAAIVAGKHPNLTGAQVKAFLMSSANDLGHDVYAQGAGRVDVGRAIDPTLTATGSLNFGRYAFPHSPVTRTHTYTNHTDQPIALKLTATISVAGQPAPAGVVTLSATELTVPAHGTAEVKVTVNGAILGEAGPYGGYNGLLNAHDGAGQLRAVSRVNAFLEPVRHELTVKVIPPAGATGIEYGNAAFIPVDDKVHLHDNPVTMPGGDTFTARLFGGTFAAAVAISWRDSAGRLHEAVPLAAEVNLTGATTVTLDLRKAKQVAARVPQAAENYHSVTRFDRVSATGAWAMTAQVDMDYGVYDRALWALPTDAVKVGTLSYDTYSVLVTPMLTMRAFGGGWPIDLAARYTTPDATISLGTQQWQEGEQAVGRNMQVPVPRLPLDGKLSVVHAGAGTAADLSKVDARGKLVLIRPADICSDTGCNFNLLRERVAAAGAAGAAGVLVAGPAGMTHLGDPPTQLVECPTGPDSCPAVQPYAALPIVTLPAQDADRLIARLERAHVEVKLGGDARPAVYNLSFHTDARVPGNLPYRVSPHDLDRVEHRVHADRPGTLTSFAWAQWVRSRPDPVSLNLPLTNTQDRLKTYVLRQSDSISRYRINWADYAAPGVLGSGRQEHQDLVLRRDHTVRWNTGPTVPGAATAARTASGYTLSSGLPCAGCRQGNVFYPTYYVTSSGGARQAMVGIVNDEGISSFLFGIANCQATACDFNLRNASGDPFERRLMHIEFRIGYGGPAATTSGGRR